MIKIEQLWQQVSDIGLVVSYPDIEKLKIRFLNRITFTTIALGVLAILVFSSIYYSAQLLITIGWLIVGLGISLYFSYVKRHSIARGIALIACLSTVVIAYIITQNQVDFYVFLFPMATLSFFIIRSQGFRTIYNVLFFLIFGFAVLLDVLLAVRVLPYQYFVHTILVAVSLLLEVLMLNFFIKESTLNQEAISKQQKLLSQAHEIAQLGSWLYHFKTQKLEWSEQVYPMLGISPDRDISLKEDWLVNIPRQWHELFLFPHGDTFFDFKYPVKVDGIQKWFRVIGKREKDEEGRLDNIFGSIQEITKTVERDEQLTYFVSLSEATIESTRDALVVTDLDGKILNYNAKVIQIWEIPEQVIVKNDEHEINDFIAENFENVALYKRQRDLIYKDNKKIFSDKVRLINGKVLEYFTQPLSVLGTVIGRVWSFRDITEEYTIAKELERKEEFYRSISDNAYDGVNIIDADGNFIYVSRSVKRILGFEVEEVLAQKIYDFVHLDDRSMIEDFFRAIKIKQRLGDSDDMNRSILRFKHKDGGWRIIESVSIDLTGNTAINGVLTNFRDITNQVAAERALIEGEDRFRKLFLDTPLGFCIRDIRTNKITQVNKKLGELYGIKHLKLVGQEVNFLAEHDDERDALLKDLIDRKIESFTLERIFRNKEGKERWCYETNSLIIIDENTFILTSYLDIDKEKKAERAFQKSNQRYRSIFENNQLGTVTLATDLRFTDINSAFCKMLGYTREELLNLTVYDVADEDDAEKNEQLLQLLIKGEINGFRLDKKYRKKDGSIVYAQTSFSGIFNKVGEYIEATATIVDITERVESATQIRNLLKQVSVQNMKLQAQSEYLQRSNKDLLRTNQELEQFAYVASHDLQEPLRMVGNFVELLEEEYNHHLDEDGKLYIKYAVNGVTRMSQLIDDLLQYSKVGNRDTVMKAVDTETLVHQKVADMSSYIVKHNAKVNINDLPEVVICAKSQISIIFNNLIHNAIKFNTKQEPIVDISCKETKDEYVFCVADNGIGIDEKNHQKIFEIFKRLHRKEIYTGTGIGLALVKRITLRHKGDVWVESKIGEGAKFYISISKYLGEEETEMKLLTKQSPII